MELFHWVLGFPHWETGSAKLGLLAGTLRAAISFGWTKQCVTTMTLRVQCADRFGMRIPNHGLQSQGCKK
jgi:hypothetical protein